MVPVKVSASVVEVIVISPLPSNATPLMFLAVASLVAVPALPVVTLAVPAVVAVVAVAAFPVILPAIGLVTVKLVKVPTLVKLEPVTVDFNVVPVKVSASVVEVIVISPLPSNATPLMFLAVASLVDVAALPFEFNFKSNATFVDVEIGLAASVVLSAEPNPTIDFVMPETIPVKVGEVIGA